MKTWIHTVATTAMLACPGLAMAGDTIATDRPGFPFSSLAVAPGRVQLEGSVAWEAGAEDGRYSTPALLRIGLATDWELRISGAGRLHDTAASPRGGWSDVALGVKHHLAASPAGASLALLAQVDLPTGEGAPGRGARPSLALAAEWSLAGGRSVGLASGLAVERDATGRGVAGSVGVLLGQPVGTRSRLYAEVAAPRIAIDGDGGPTVTAGFGGSHLVGDDTQLDIGYSAGLSRAAPDHSVAIGLSRRW